MIEILCNGKVHYARPDGHPDVAEALALIEWHKKNSGVSSYEVRPTFNAADLAMCSVHGFPILQNGLCLRCSVANTPNR